MVHVGTGVIVPSGIVDTTVVSNTGFDVGASIGIGATDDRAIGANCKTINLNRVHTTVVVFETGEILLSIIDTTIGNNIVAFGHNASLSIPTDIGDNLMNAGVDKHCVGIDHSHVVATIELILIRRGNGPLVRRIRNITFTNPYIGTTHNYLGAVDRRNGDSTAGFGGCIAGVRSYSGS